jgi:hypothetical protein
MGQANMNIMEDASYSFSDVLKDWGYRVLLVLKYWKKLSIAGLFVSILFLTYAYLKPITYSARISFVVEDAKSGGGSLASALSGAFGIDLGGMAGGNSMIAGDNVLELLKSKSLIKKTLLTTINSSNLKDSNSTIADQYAKVNGLYNNWVKDLGRKIEFNKNGGLTEDSLLHIMIEKISEKELSIAKPDKKLSVFELQVTMKDELLCKLFCERLWLHPFTLKLKQKELEKTLHDYKKGRTALVFY